MRTRFALISMTLVLCVSASMAFAQEGNTRKGKFLYRKSCRSCHGVSASDLSPSSKTRAEWQAIFADVQKIPCNKDWPALSETDLKDMHAYAHEYAKDSPTPAKCE